MTDQKPNPLTSLLSQPVTDSEANPFVGLENFGETITTDAAIEAAGVLDPEERARQERINQPLESVAELAHRNTDEVTALRSRADAAIVETEKFILRTGESFRSVADALDTMIGGDKRLSGFDLAGCRNYVRALMTSLAKNPEFETILLDNDVRNVVKFGTLTYQEAIELDAIKEDTKTRKAATPSRSKAKPKLSSSMMDAMAAGLDSFITGASLK